MWRCKDCKKNTKYFRSPKARPIPGRRGRNMFSPNSRLRMGRIYTRKKIKTMLQVEDCEGRHKGEVLEEVGAKNQSVSA